MKKRLAIFPVLAVFLCLSLFPSVRAESAAPLAAELVHICNEAENELCLAASADGTRFLVLRNQYPAFDLWVQNEDGSDKKELVLTGISEEEAESILGLSAVNTAGRAGGSSKKSKEELAADLVSSVKAQYGSAANGLLHRIWQSPQASRVSAAGDYVLLYDASFGHARVNMKTGETVLLYRLFTLMKADGTVFCFSDSHTDERTVGILSPDQTVPEEAQFPLPANIINAPFSMSLQEDGSLWMLGTVYLDPVEQENGRKIIPQKLVIAHYDQDGNLLHRIEGGAFDYSALPMNLYFSEQTGTGILCSDNAYYSTLWVFSVDDGTLKPLLLENLYPPSLRAAEREEVVDEFGRPLESGRRGAAVFGLSQSGTKLLFQDLDSASLLSLDLRTLKADVMMYEFQILLLMQGHTDRPGSILSSMGWNGAQILVCAGGLKGYVIRLPFTD